jgi:mevalonate kinase
MGRATAHGKVILAGEHFVVYGTAAIALPVSSRGVTVDVERRPGVWEVPVGVEEHLLRCLECLGEQAEGLTVRVHSTLPIGAGLGGSAALAVALVRALAQDGVTDIEVRARAHRLEELAHGSPSGIDDAVATFGCPVFMSPVRTVEPLALAELPRVWIAVSDEPSLTLEAVTRVGEIKKSDERRFSALRARGAELVALAHAALLACDWTGLGAVMIRNHELLSELGVSTPALDRLVAVAQQAGAYGAKLTGAGCGGAVLALAPEGVELGEPWLQSGAREVIAP